MAAKTISPSTSDDGDGATVVFTVFVDNHLALIVSDTDTVSNLKKSYAAKGKGRISYLVDSQPSDMMNKSIGEILRSSSRFNKAKLTASQLSGRC